MSGDLGAATFAALGIAVSPVPFLVALALVSSDGTRGRASAFVSGQALAVVAVVAGVVFLLPVDDPDEGGVATALAVLEIAVGTALAALLVVHLRRARAGSEQQWERLLDRVDTRAALAGGAAMIVVNPKNLALTLAGSAAMLRLGWEGARAGAAVLVFGAISVSCVFALVVAARVFPKRTVALLEPARAFVVRHELGLGTIVLGGLASFFLLHGLSSV